MDRIGNVFRGVLLTFAGITASIAAALALVACSDISALPAPQNVYVTDAGYLVWDEVDGANGYVVEFDGKTYETEINSFDVFDLTNSPKTYSARVMSCGDLKYTDDSAWSNVCEYKVSGAEKWNFKLINNDSEYAVTCQDKDISGKLLFPTVGPDGKPVTAVNGAGGVSLKNVTSIWFHHNISRIVPGVMFVNNAPIARLAVSKNNIFYKDEGNCIIRNSDDALVLGCGASAIPDHVKSIEDNAFAYCDDLEKIDVPDGMQSIGNGAFSGCKKLGQINIPSTVKSIGGMAFYHCKELKEISLPEGVDTIGTQTFSGCKSLQTVKLPSTLTKLNPDAFIGCAAINEVIIDENNPVFKVDGNCIMRIADNAVACGFENSVIPDYAEIIGASAFTGRKMSHLTLPEGIRVIENSAYAECPALEEVVFPSTLKMIGSAAFVKCVNLKRYRLPYGLTEIGSKAFFECKNIEVPVAIPETVTTIGGGAFYGGTFYYCGDLLYPDGWHTPAFNGDEWWNSAAGSKCAGIVMGYDGCYPYVDTFTYKKAISQTEVNGGISSTTVVYWGTYLSSYISVPYRKGYTFAGWATERGGEVKLGVTEMIGNDGKTTFKVCLTRDDVKQISDGTTLYAVWTPDAT